MRCATGVRAVVILDGRAPNACLLELFTDHGAGSADPRAAADCTPRGAADLGLSHGALSAEPGDGLPMIGGTLLLLGPDEPAFWPLFQASPEYPDGAPIRWIAGRGV